MENPMILRTVNKVDQAVARIQKLQTSIATSRMDPETSSSFEPPRSGQSRSPRIDYDKFFGGYKMLAEFKKTFLMKEEEVPIASKAIWRQWSAPAEVVHQVISEICVASRFAKELGALITDSAEQLRYHNEHEHLEKLKGGSEKHVFCNLKVSLQGPAGQKQVCNDIIYSQKDECAQACTYGPNFFEYSLAPATSLADGSHSFSMKETSKMSMEATKIITAKKLWKIFLPTNAVIFPNQSFAPNSSPPSSPTLLKSSTALKHVDALSTANQKNLTSSQQRLLSVGKLQDSPSQKLTSTSSGSGIAKDPHNCEKPPIPYLNDGIKKPIKVPLINSQVDTRDCFRKSHGCGRSCLQNVNHQRSSTRLSKMKNADMFNDKRCFQKKVVDGKLEVFQLVNNKEKFQLAGCTPAALCLKRSWF